jgi:hypothetical protein
VDITVDDVKTLTFELYIAHREIAALRAANTELKQLLDQATATAEGVADADTRRR